MLLPRRRFLAQVAAGFAVGPTLGRADGRGPEPRLASGTELTPDPALDDRVTRALAAARASKHRFPGMVAALARLDRTLGIAADGIRKLGAPDRITSADCFHLGSCTKAMTATMLARLVEAGRLGWDTTLAGAFPAEADAMHADYRGVTLDRLLRHRGGLPANVDWWQIRGKAETLGEQRRALAATVLRAAPVAPPGSKYLYSNVGYTLAAAMAEAATGSPWEDLMQRQVFEPLGMGSAGFGPPGRADAVDQPWGHQSLGPIFLPTRIDNPPVMGPAGTVHLSVADWARFALFHLGDGTVGDRRLLQAATLQALHDAPANQDYAAGWIVVRPEGPGGELTWQHGGSNTVWFAYLVLAPQRGVAALVACNGSSESAETACIQVADALIAP